MDMEKLKQWIQFAQRVQGGGDFWNSIFDQDQTSSFMNSTSGQTGPEPAAHHPVPPQLEYPLIDIFLNEKNLFLIISLAGVAKEDMKLAINNHNSITVSGIVKPLFQHAASVQTERKYGPFERTIKLPEPVENSNTAAKYINGLLIVTFDRIIRGSEHISID